MNSPVVPRRPRKYNGEVLLLSFLVLCVGFGAMVTMAFRPYIIVSSAVLKHIVSEATCDGMKNYLKDLLDDEIGLSKYQRLKQQGHSYVNGMLTLEAVPESRLEKVEEEKVRRPRPFKILIGIMTTAKKTERRHLLRMAYRAQSTQIAQVEVKFVIGKLKDKTDKILVGLENLVYQDIMELDCEENMNHGKTFTFFSTLADTVAKDGTRHDISDRFWDYVMKTDDDSYVRTDNLAKHLLPLPRIDLYYGYILPCENQDPYKWYMAGMGYLISWDLVDWIRDSPIPRNNSEGTEDQLVGKWFDEGGKARNRVNDKPLLYDYPAFGGKCAHELIHETILIHQVKTTERWADVLSFFQKDFLTRAQEDVAHID